MHLPGERPEKAIARADRLDADHLHLLDARGTGTLVAHLQPAHGDRRALAIAGAVIQQVMVGAAQCEQSPGAASTVNESPLATSSDRNT